MWRYERRQAATAGPDRWLRGRGRGGGRQCPAGVGAAVAITAGAGGVAGDRRHLLVHRREDRAVGARRVPGLSAGISPETSAYRSVLSRHPKCLPRQ